MLVTQAAYARQRGCSKQYINQMVKEGQVKLVRGKIDPAIADACFARRADPAREPQARHHAEKRGHELNFNPPAVELPADDRAPAMDTGRYIETDMTRAKTADAVYAAKLKQAEYEREIGKLVEADSVRKAIADISSSVNQFATIPDRLASRLAAETDVRRCHLMVMTEIDACMQAVADFAKALSERLAATPQ